MKTLGSIFFTVILFSSCSREYTCEDFRQGSYQFAEADFSDVEITRNDSVQIEVSTRPGAEYRDVYQIIWTGACSYSMVLIETDSPDRMSFTPYDTINASILEIVEDGYMVETMVGDRRPVGRLIKVK